MWVRSPLQGERRPARASETKGKGLAKKYARNVEEEDPASVVGAGVLAGQVADVGPPEYNRGAVAARGIMAKKERRAFLTSGIPSVALVERMVIRPGLTGRTLARIQWP